MKTVKTTYIYTCTFPAVNVWGEKQLQLRFLKQLPFIMTWRQDKKSTLIMPKCKWGSFITITHSNSDDHCYNIMLHLGLWMTLKLKNKNHKGRVNVGWCVREEGSVRWEGRRSLAVSTYVKQQGSSSVSDSGCGPTWAPCCSLQHINHPKTGPSQPHCMLGDTRKQARTVCSKLKYKQGSTRSHTHTRARMHTHDLQKAAANFR